MRTARVPVSVVVALLGAATVRASEPPPVAPADAELLPLIGAILRADYRGDRPELARLAAAVALGTPRPGSIGRAYWTGFAHWRRGINGFSETPPAADVAADFERCAEQMRTALARDPAFDEARGALAGCLMGQAYALGSGLRDRQAALLRQSLDLIHEMEPRAQDNPRSLWMLGGSLMLPPEQGGDLGRAKRVFLAGLEAARREALRPGREAWLPSWGAPENLMSLAFVHTLGTTPDPAVARAYAEGALALVPDWRFVRDQLMVRIERLSSAPKDARP